jgi:proline iminopeptidase
MYKHKYLKYKTKYLSKTSSEVDISYPVTLPYNSGMLPVGDNHVMYYEQVGNPNGMPILVIHGGPGGGIPEKYSTFYDTTKYRVIAYDQRGCGKSTPFGSLENNTTWHLINDIEKLREHLKIDKWKVTGGSWGSTLTLLYAIHHPKRVLGMLISGVCLLRQEDIDWLYKKGGVSNIYPEEWDKFESFIPENERDDLVKAYYKRLCSPIEEIRNEACLHWSQWEIRLSFFHFDDSTEIKLNNKINNLNKIIPLAKIECHYFINKAFLKTDNYIIENIQKIKDIPLIINQTRFDVICPVDSAYRIKKELPNTNLKIIPLGGHSRGEQPAMNYMINSLNELLNFA